MSISSSPARNAAGRLTSIDSWSSVQTSALPSRCVRNRSFFSDTAAVANGYGEYLRRHFRHRQPGQVLGEKSTSYIERDDAMLGICSMLPRARLIFVLRDPVMRAYSNWRFSRMHGLENLGFAAALDAENHRFRRGKIDTVSVDPFAYVARGHYKRHLERWARHFERDRFIIMTSEDI